MAQTVKRLSTMRETWVQSLGWEDPLEKEMAIHSSTIAWKRGFPWWLSGKGSACQSRRCGFDLSVRKIPLEEGRATPSSILAWRIPETV